jgi:hypothetical protein
MRRLALALAVAGLLSSSATAHAGGWANVKLSGLPPVSPSAGQTWTVDLDIKQHGVTPMSDIRPAILLRAADGTDTRFAARPTDKVGVYRATVRWPSGRWTMHVDDGFTNAFPHKYPTIDVRPAAAAPAVADAGTSTLVWVAVAAGAVAMLFLPALLLRRRRTLAA